jgi:hypothetical protein
MFHALITVAYYAIIGFALLYGACLFGFVCMTVWDRVHREVTEEDFTPWEVWDWPIPDDVDGWDFPEREAA